MDGALNCGSTAISSPLSRWALGRVGQPDDIGAAIALLLAPGSQWINGQRVEASGGMFL
jgi:NAD(P)-dependent dehydrogenase (short-subunit alcohol dehydrogenase family)